MTPKRLPGGKKSDENLGEAFWSGSQNPPQRYCTLGLTIEDTLCYSPLVTRTGSPQMRQHPESMSQDAYSLESTSNFANNESPLMSGYTYYTNVADTIDASLNQLYHHSRDAIDWNGSGQSQQFPTGSGYSSPAQTPRRPVPAVPQPVSAYPTYSSDNTSKPGHSAANYFEGARPVTKQVLPDKKRPKLGAGGQRSTSGPKASPQIGSSTGNPPELLYADQTSPTRDFSNLQKSPSTPTQPPLVPTSLIPPIGYVYLTDNPHKYRYECRHPGCDATCGRQVDFDRHYNAFHAPDKTEFWCTVEGCNRGEAGNDPFARKDKLKDHLRQAHRIG